MAISRFNQRIEVKAVQITGDKQGEAGVYARLLRDLEGNYFNDIRYFGFSPDKKVHYETTRGVILNESQIYALRKALKEFSDFTKQPPA